MPWTTDRPSENGVYWYRHANRKPIVVYIYADKGQVIFFGNESTCSLEEDCEDGEWCGPVEAPAASHLEAEDQRCRDAERIS